MVELYGVSYLAGFRTLLLAILAAGSTVGSDRELRELLITLVLATLAIVAAFLLLR